MRTILNKNLYVGLAALFLSASVTLTSCNKDKEDPQAAETELADQSQDEQDFSAETEQVLNDADLAVFNQVTITGGRLGAFCGAADIDTSTTTPRRYTINFDGTTECNGRIRSGTIILTLYNADSWAQRDAVLGVEFRAFTVKRTADSRIITLNATGKIYNLYGGLARDVSHASGPDSVVHRIRLDGARMNSNGVTLTDWHVAKKRFFVNRGNTDFYTITTAGDTVKDGQTLVGVFGKSRRNRDFVTRFNRPIHSTSQCGWFKPVSGQKQHMGFARNVLVTFGVDAEGVVVNQNGSENCAYGYKAEWTGVNGNQVRIVPYR